MVDKTMGVGAAVHAGAGLLALVMGGMMYMYTWAPGH